MRTLLKCAHTSHNVALITLALEHQRNIAMKSSVARPAITILNFRLFRYLF